MVDGNAGKGDKPRPSAISWQERNLRYALACGHITFDEYETRYKELKKQGKIFRRF